MPLTTTKLLAITFLTLLMYGFIALVLLYSNSSNHGAHICLCSSFYSPCIYVNQTTPFTMILSIRSRKPHAKKKKIRIFEKWVFINRIVSSILSRIFITVSFKYPSDRTEFQTELFYYISLLLNVTFSLLFTYF